MAKKKKSATNKKTVEQGAKQIGIRISMYLDMLDFTNHPPTTSLNILGMNGERMWLWEHESE